MTSRFFSTRRLPAALWTFAALVVAATAGHAAWRIKQSVELARQSEPLQASPTGATASLLIAGDSTAVGTGASSAASSVAGLIARDHPGLRIVNRAQDGARFADIVRQLQGDERFDAVLVMGGGNDVIRLTGEEALAQNIARVAQLAAARAPLVVLMPPGNVGNAPFFMPPLSWLMAKRSRTLHGLVRQSAADHGAIYVNMYKSKAEDPFAQRPGELNARDGLHPSDAGYLLWYDALNTQAELGRRLRSLKAH
ncbi:MULTISPECIES: GDSL-type esterase/lipase family protein [unclassified Polaromonas]|jgi:lysophospholipase L1-like esterase|uniref:SGNH/GDSL hydrolase family protein n=1 Tax=unclassified Polaromonas TaxID=2638319 RepID=UPI0018C9F953|nr:MULTISPECIES: GDSL-type esterase/lipase family protein [unclassified Polaromonas]MBG6071540.1 lysophospholipase L1-like esterase [Polaromonas sp. CG_9.7]MBG6113541.1 lysophospholipase L1-like esterase [Polaromonas sp. CG_9.2]MDH6184562.1 lysophospholipase L1-like esterase [Polaromonas sp. CG_23.6]